MRINFRFLLILLGALLLLGSSISIVHWFQAGRNAREILRQARVAQEEQRSDDALRLYTRYLAMDPSSVEARIELGELLADRQAYEPAFMHLEAALRVAPEMRSARRRLVDVSMAMNRFTDANSHLENFLLVERPQDAELLWLRGRCEAKLGQHTRARQNFEAALAVEPTDARVALELANLLTTRFNESLKARHLLDAVIAVDPTSSLAYLARAQWLYGRTKKQVLDRDVVVKDVLEDSWRDAQQAVQLDGNDVDALLLAVNIALATDRANQARTFVSKALQSNPDVAELYGSAAQIELVLEHPKKAVEVLKRGLKALPGNLDLIWNLAQLELRQGQLELAETLIGELRLRGYPSAPLHLLDAELLSERGFWREAIEKLEASRAGMDGATDLLKQAEFLLSTCHRKTGNLHEELVALRRTVDSDPQWQVGREALANALVRSGRIQEAVNEYWQIAQLPYPNNTALLNLARLLLIDGLKNGVHTHDWSRFQQTLDSLTASDSHLDDVCVLQAELWFAAGQLEKAENLLRQRIATQPQEAATQLALIGLLLRSEAWENADQAIQQAEINLGDLPALRLERSRYLIGRYGRELDLNLLENLGDPDDAWDEQQVAELASGLSGQFLAMEEYERAEKFARQLADSYQGERNLAIHLMLFELAFRSSDLKSMKQTLDRVKQIEGQGPLWQVGEAVRLSVEAVDLGQPALHHQALKILDSAAILRPNWSRIHSLKAEIYDLLNHDDQAIASYLESINLGERNSQVISKVTLKLFQLGRFVEADELIRKLQEQQTPFSSLMVRVAAEVSLQLENYDQALTLAKNWAENSDSLEARLWMAQVYGITGDEEAALREFEQVLELAPNSAAAWVSLVQLYARKGDVTSAQQVIDRAQRQLAAEDLHATLAQCYEATEDFPQAEKHYLAAIDEKPGQPELLRRVADYYLRASRPLDAQQFLESLVNQGGATHDAGRRWARRNLSLVIGLHGGESQSARAQQLIDLNLVKTPPAIEDLRTKAMLLASRPDRKSADDAIRILESIVLDQRDYPLSDNFLLAELYLRIDDWTRYSRTIRGVLGNGGGENSHYLSNYTSALIARGESAEAQLWLERLKKIAPQEINTVAIEAQLLSHSKNYNGLLELLQGSIRDDPQGLLWAAEMTEKVAGGLLRDNDSQSAQPFIELADRLFTQVAEVVPGRRAALATFYAKLGKVDQALELSSVQVLNSPQDLVAIAQAALQSGKLDQTTLASLIAHAQQLVSKQPNHKDLQLSLGDLHSWAEQWQPAAAAYRHVLSLDSASVPAMNNLAMVLALSQLDPEFAEQIIETAIRLVGPRDFLLDTRGVVSLAAGKAEAAARDFRQSLESQVTPERYFHLAQALLAMQKPNEARQFLEKAQAIGLSAATVHPLERPALQVLKETLVQPRSL